MYASYTTSRGTTALGCCFSNMATTRLNSTDDDWGELTKLLKKADNDQTQAYAASIVLVLACMLVGSVGNVVVCIVYSAKIGKSNTNMFILQLCIFDLFACLIVMPFQLAILLKTFTFTSDVVCKICFYSTYVCTSSSLVVLMAIALDRYNKVCRLLKPGITIRMATHLFWVALAVGAVSSISAPHLYGISARVYRDHHDGALVNGTTCGVLDTVRGTTLQKINVYTLFAVFMAVYCFITVLYSLVAVRVRQRARRPQPTVTSTDTTFKGQGRFPEQPSASWTIQQQTNHHGTEKQKASLNSISDNLSKSNRGTGASRQPGNEQKGFRGPVRGTWGKTSTMLILVSVVFLLSWLPLWIILVRETSVEHATNWSGDRLPDGALEKFGRTLFLLNHAINPIIYSLFNKQFRSDCKLRFSKIRQRLRC